MIVTSLAAGEFLQCQKKKDRWNECTSPIFTMPSAAEVTRVERKRFRAKNSSDLTCWGLEITVSRGSRFGIIRHWLPGCSGLAFGWLASLAQLSAPSTSAWAAIGGGTHSSRTSRGTRRGKSILRCFLASSIRVFPRRMPSSDCRGRSTPRSSYQRRSVLKMRKFLNIFGAQFVSHPKGKNKNRLCSKTCVCFVHIGLKLCTGSFLTRIYSFVFIKIFVGGRLNSNTKFLKNITRTRRVVDLLGYAAG